MKNSSENGLFKLITLSLVLTLISTYSSISKAESNDLGNINSTIDNFVRDSSINPHRINKWIILDSEKNPALQDSANKCDYLVVVQFFYIPNKEPGNDNKFNVTEFCLLKKGEHYSIENYFSYIQGPDPEHDYFHDYIDNLKLATDCSDVTLAKKYYDLEKSLTSRNRHHLLSIMKELNSSAKIAVMAPPLFDFSEPEQGAKNSRLNLSKFSKWIVPNTLIDDFLFNTENLRKRFTEAYVERYFDFSKGIFVKRNLKYKSEAVSDILLKLDKTKIETELVPAFGTKFKTSKINLNFKGVNIPKEVLIPPKFVCTTQGWKITHFFSKY